MDGHRVLTRPESAEEVPEATRALATALEAMGVSRGKQYAVITLEELNALLETTDGDKSIYEGNLGAFAKDSETSRNAALMNYPKRATQKGEILACFETAGEEGLTRHEALGMMKAQGSKVELNSILPRVKELLEGDFLEATARTRATPSGAEGEVLVITTKTLQLAAEFRARSAALA